jgi:alginate biosynthesis protein AlgK
MDHTYLAKPDEVIAMLKKARANGDVRASLILGRLFERGRFVAREPAKAVQYAKEATEQYASAEYLLGRIYKRGYLGEPEPRKALKYLLSAARRDSARADFLLARLYWDGEGVAINRRYAWSFATLALEGGYERARKLLAEMAPSTPTQTRAEADQLRQREVIARQRQYVRRLEAQGSAAKAGQGE